MFEERVVAFILRDSKGPASIMQPRVARIRRKRGVGKAADYVRGKTKLEGILPRPEAGMYFFGTIRKGDLHLEIHVGERIAVGRSGFKGYFHHCILRDTRRSLPGRRLGPSRHQSCGPDESEKFLPGHAAIFSRVFVRVAGRGRRWVSGSAPRKDRGKIGGNTAGLTGARSARMRTAEKHGTGPTRGNVIIAQF